MTRSGFEFSDTILINSHYREDPTNPLSTPDNFSYRLILPRPISDYTHVAVNQASVPKTYYTVSGGRDTFTVIEMGVPRTLRLGQGMYTNITFPLGVVALLNGVAGQGFPPVGWVYSMNSTYAAHEGDKGLWNFLVAGNLGNQPSFQFEGEDMWQSLGFNPDTTVVFVGNSLTSTNIWILQQTPVVYLNSNLSTSNQGILQHFMMSGVADWDLYHFVQNDLESGAFALNSGTTNVATFFLSDDHLKQLDINYSEWVFTLTFFKKSTTDSLHREVLLRQL